MNEYLNILIEWIGNHPNWAGIVVFLVNLSESLVVVGLFVPGTVVMFGIGALVALGAMGLWSTLAWAVLGALVGDGVSYMVGRHYHEHLRVMWPFNRHPEWIQGAEKFFVRHGSKSVIFGRFVGPVRPVIPAVAGMMGMPAISFYWANFISALIWAPAYILPGVIFGASLNLASQIATRLALILVLLLLLIWVTMLVVRRIYALLQPRTQLIVLHLLAWGRAHPLFQNVTIGLLDPSHPELKGLIELGVMFLFGGWIFFTILVGEIGHSQPLGLDYQVYFLLQGLRSHWADQAMVFLSELTDIPVTLMMIGAGFAWLVIERHWLAASHWVAAMGMAVLIGLCLHYLLPGASPLPGIYLGEMKGAFPSIHATLVSTFYGFLAVMVARELPSTLRRLPYTVVAVWLILMMITQLYLGRYWLSDVIGGVALGVIWSVFVGIAYRSRAAVPVDLKKLLGLLLLMLLFAGGGYVMNLHGSELMRYAVRHPEMNLERALWWEQDWKKLACYQLDWRGADNTPMTLQVAGDLTELQNHLERHDWRVPATFNMVSILGLLLPSQGITDLPVLPHSHDGRQEMLRLVRYQKVNATPTTRLLLRLWRADARLTPDGIPLWVGNVIRQRIIEPLGLMTLPKIDVDYESPLVVLHSALQDLQWRKVIRDAPYPPGWKGSVLLIKAPDGPQNITTTD
ncbi:membrane-associated protein [Gammaproteobacteria bacterium]